MANVWTTTGGLESTASNVHEVDPISRIEGHLGVKVVVDPGTNKIIDANAHGNLWRGFENFLLGRDVNDAITFVQRICGVCPVPHGLTSTYAVDTVLGYSRGHITFKTATEGTRTYGVPAKAVLIRNLVLGAEFLMSSITHFYHLAAPSYVQGPAIPPWTPFFDNSYYAAALLNPGGNTAVPNIDAPKVWDAVILSYVKALKFRRMTFEAGALFAGRMPMTSCYVGGGVTNDGTENQTDRANKFKDIITEVALFVVQEYVPIALALGALYPAFDNTFNGGGGTGAGLGRFLAWGGFPQLDDSLGLPGGVFDSDATAYVAPGAYDVDSTHFRVLNKADVYAKFLAGGTYAVPDNLTEDIAHSRYDIAPVDAGAYTGTAAYPGDVARTMPKRSNGYSYMKAPRWANKACEVGPFARMVVAGFYPVDGTSLVGTFPGAATIYTTSQPGNLNGVDIRPGIISATVVAGLVNQGGTVASDVTNYIANCKGGLSTMDRLRARALESLYICQLILGDIAKDDLAGTVSFPGTNGWIHDLLAASGSTWRARPGAMPAAGSLPAYNPYGVNQGWGGTEAPRGALMHQTTISNGKIQKYQAIVPTTWNGSPKDSLGNRGAIEESMIGASFSAAGAVFVKQADTGAGTTTQDTAGGVEVLRNAQSFDPCIACAIH